MKVLKWFFRVVLLISLLAIPFAVVSADAGVPSPVRAPAVDIGQVLALVFTDTLIKQLLSFLGLIILQLALAVALSIKKNLFEWSKLADFYKTLVLPYVIGWMAFIVVARLITADLLGPTYQVIVGDGVTWLAWLAVVTSLGARIVSTVKELYGKLAPFPTPTDNDPV